MRKLVFMIFAGAVVLFAAIQIIPYGHNHSNPAVLVEPQWNSQQTRDLAVRACFDCHSNQTTWPWYSNIAPISWLIQHDVDEGRSVLNFSEWGSGGRRSREAGEVVLEGEMPPFYFILLHPEAKLSSAEKQALAQGLQGSLGRR
jgi:mono/diheme cytochrome c family protein